MNRWRFFVFQFWLKRGESIQWRKIERQQGRMKKSEKGNGDDNDDEKEDDDVNKKLPGKLKELQETGIVFVFLLQFFLCTSLQFGEEIEVELQLVNVTTCYPERRQLSRGKKDLYTQKKSKARCNHAECQGPKLAT